MVIRPIPGADRNTILKNLQHVYTQVGNVRSMGHTPLDLYNNYISWVNESVRMLHHHLSSEDLEQTVLTKRSWMLQSMAGSAVGSLSILVETEIDDRFTALGLACEDLATQISRWSRPGVLVVPDTSFYCHGEKLEDWDVSGLLDSRHDPVHLLFPMVVVDELDRLKESGNRDVRWRARYTLAVLDRVLGNSSAGRLRAADSTGIDAGQLPKGEVTLEIVLDPSGHLRLPIEDDEIVDGALAIQALAGRPVTMITYDTGQAHRARMQGLKALKLEMPKDPEHKHISRRDK